MQENFTILSQGAALERPTFLIKLLRFWFPGPCHAAILDCREIHRIVQVSWETFLNDHLLKKDYPLQSSTIHCEIEDLILPIHHDKVMEWHENRWVHRFKHFTSKAEVECCPILVELILTMVWLIIREFFFGIESWKMSWLYGISLMESQLQNWGLSTNSRSSTNWHRDPTVGYESNFTNFYSYLNRKHTTIDIPDSHDVQCHDDATVISTIDPEGLPRSGASCSSKQTAARRVPSMFGPSSPWKQMAGYVSGRSGLHETGGTRSPRILTSRRRSVSRNRKPRRRTGFNEENRSPSWSTTTFEWLALMTQHYIMLISFLSSVTLHHDDVPEFDTRWDEVLQSMIPSDDILESLYKLRICGSAQLKTVLELYEMEIQLQEENESGGANGPNGRPIFPRKTHCVFDLQILSENGAHEAVLDYWDQFSITSHGDDIQNFDNCWDQVFLSTSEVPTDSILESLYKRRIRESRQLVRALCRVWSRALVRSPLACHPRSNAIGLPVLTKFSHQKRMNWNRSIGKDSKRKECQSWKETKRLRTVESKRTVYKGNACRFRHDDSTCGQQAQSSSLVPSVCLLCAAGHTLARRDHQDRCSTRRWRSPKHRARHTCTTCCDTRSERWSTGGPGGMEILGPASRTDLTDVQYGSVARALELQLRGRDGGSNGTFWPRHRPLLASRSQKHPYRRCSSNVARRTVETTPCPQQYSVDHVGDSESRDRQCQTHTSCVDTTPTCTRADALFCRAHLTVHNLLHFANVGTPYWLKVKGFCVAHFSALISISFSMSLLNVPLVRFPPVTSSLTCPVSRTSASWTSLGRSRVNPCASANWSGMSGCLANLTSNTGYEPNFYSYMNEEHTPINLPDSHRSFQCRDDATIISTTEDPEGFPHSGASGSTLQTGSHNVGIFSCSPLEAVAWSWVGWQSYGHPGSWCKCGIQNLLFELLSVHSQKGREIENKTLCIRWERISKKSLNGKLTWPSWSWGWSWGKKLGEEKFWHRFSRDQSRTWISTISGTSSK